MLICVSSSRQENEVGLYVGLTQCLSEMSDTEIERITRVTEVQHILKQKT